jgi:hypothetical protein
MRDSIYCTRYVYFIYVHLSARLSVCVCVCVCVFSFFCSSCSFAAFGPTNNYVTFPTETVTGPMKRLSSKESCVEAPPGAVSSSSAPARPPVEEGVTEDQEKDGSGEESPAGTDPHMGHQEKAYDGKVVVADRGSCMFEEKTIAAENAGAQAVIVINSEVRTRNRPPHISVTLSCW